MDKVKLNHVNKMIYSSWFEHFLFLLDAGVSVVFDSNSYTVMEVAGELMVCIEVEGTISQQFIVSLNTFNSGSATGIALLFTYWSELPHTNASSVIFLAWKFQMEQLQSFDLPPLCRWCWLYWCHGNTHVLPILPPQQLHDHYYYWWQYCRGNWVLLYLCLLWRFLSWNSSSGNCFHHKWWQWVHLI